MGCALHLAEETRRAMMKGQQGQTAGGGQCRGSPGWKGPRGPPSPITSCWRQSRDRAPLPGQGGLPPPSPEPTPPAAPPGHRSTRPAGDLVPAAASEPGPGRPSGCRWQGRRAREAGTMASAGRLLTPDRGVGCWGLGTRVWHPQPSMPSVGSPGPACGGPTRPEGSFVHPPRRCGRRCSARACQGTQIPGDLAGQRSR